MQLLVFLEIDLPANYPFINIIINIKSNYLFEIAILQTIKLCTNKWTQACLKKMLYTNYV